MNFGVTPEGFRRKTLSEIETQAESSIRGDIDQSFNLERTSPSGQFLGILLDLIAEGWQLAEDIYNSRYPATSEGQSLDNAAAFVNSRRLSPRPTFTDCDLEVTEDALIPAGTILQLDDTDFEFQTLRIIDTRGIAQASSIERVSLASTVNERIRVRIGSTFSSDNQSIVSGTARAPIVEGFSFERDEDFKIRTEQQRSGSSSGTLISIEEALEDLPGVLAVSIFSNLEGFPDDDGRPPNSIQIVVLGGDDVEIAQTIFRKVAPGTTLIGDPVVIIDARRRERVIRFSRAIPVRIRAAVRLVYELNQVPVGDERASIVAFVREKISAAVNLLEQGEDVVANPYLVSELSELEGLVSSLISLNKNDGPIDPDGQGFLRITDLEVARLSPSDVQVILIANNANADLIDIQIILNIVATDSFGERQQGEVFNRILFNLSSLKSEAVVSETSILGGVHLIEGFQYVNRFQVGRLSDGLLARILRLSDNERAVLTEENFVLTVTADD